MRSASFLRVVAIGIVALASGAAPAQGWPDKPIRVIVSFPPGGVHDTLTRVLQPRLTEALGQPIVIDNRGGAGGNIAADAVAKSAPDGYTFLVGSEALATNQFLYRSLSYDINKDLVPVAKLADYPVALIAHPSLSANTVSELVALARAKPGEISFGSAGVGTAGHLAGELFRSMAGIDMLHVPYKGGAAAMNDVMAGRIQVMFLSVALSAPQVRQGKLKALAIAGRKCAGLMPDVPTTAEAGYPEFEAPLFSSLYAPAGTPAAVLERMNAELQKALLAGDVQKRLAELGAVPAPSSAEDFSRLMKDAAARLGKLIRERNLQLD